jgi:hypothetical protein
MYSSSPKDRIYPMRATDLQNLKKRVSAGLLNIAGVSGVGISGGKLAVYLENDSETVRQQVTKVVAAEAENAPVTYVVTGKFRPH